MISEEQALAALNAIARADHKAARLALQPSAPHDLDGFADVLADLERFTRTLAEQRRRAGA